MFDRLIAWSLGNRLIVLLLAVAQLGGGVWIAREAPVDEFPDLTAPTVTSSAGSLGHAGVRLPGLRLPRE